MQRSLLKDCETHFLAQTGWSCLGLLSTGIIGMDNYALFVGFEDFCDLNKDTNPIHENCPVII
jgi:hypothetical protein